MYIHFSNIPISDIFFSYLALHSFRTTVYVEHPFDRNIFLRDIHLSKKPLCFFILINYYLLSLFINYRSLFHLLTTVYSLTPLKLRCLSVQNVAMRSRMTSAHDDNVSLHFVSLHFVTHHIIIFINFITPQDGDYITHYTFHVTIYRIRVDSKSI